MPLEFSTYFPMASILEHPRQPEEWDRALERFTALLHPSFTTLWRDDHPQLNAVEAWTTAVWLAAKMPRFTVGHLVMAQSYRNPGLLARMGATLQFLTNGRFIMGLGAGWHEADYRAFNYDFPRPGVRVEQLAETVELLRAMWSGSPATYHGQHYQVEAATSAPLPDPPIPILIGTNGPRAMRVAARLADIWSWDLNDAFADQVALLRRSCAEFGRAPEAVRIFAGAEVQFPEDAADFAPIYDPRAARPDYGYYEHIGTTNRLGPTPEHMIEQLKPYRDLGIEHFILDADEATLRRISDEVIPKLD
ncbi:MAG TPA: LLM class flavin-dependent oxidoreductase [Ktedonobacterales bacterium]|nr:LLM class flavin-dependent oxidoreductase [Ktedonobacterales bacterium]